jgi:hypothetical protein
MEAFRKIIIRFENQEGMDELSEKLFAGTDYKLLRNMREVYLTEQGFDFAFKKNVRKKEREKKEWEHHWIDLTPFSPEKKKSFGKIEFSFSEMYDNEKLTELLGQNITIKSKSLYYPKKISDGENLKRVIGTRGNPQYPIYIISKGRAKTCVTADHLIKMEVPFRIVIEKSEWEAYAEHYGEECLLELDLSFRDGYDTYIKDFDPAKSKGSGPARNFVWHHAKNVIGSEWHWIMDDNLFGFNYYLDQQRLKAVDGTIFASAEDFVNRYDNIGVSGLNYYMFAVPGSKDRPYVSNTKIYSCLLINNNIPIRWAGRYNEDVDLCIRALKEGYSTIQFDAFLSKKGGTQTMGGGNTDAFYAEEGTLPKSNMLAYNHPDITHVQWRFQRWHHMTSYDIFDKYKDRTIGETIEALMAPQIVDPVKDRALAEEIAKIDFNWINDWDILPEVPEPKRTEIIDVLKMYRYTKDPGRILKAVCRSKIIDCEYYKHIWENEIQDTIDNSLMLDLLDLGDENGVLNKVVDWDAYLHYIPEAKRKIIVDEMVRNKYLLKDSTQKFEYNLQEFMLSEQEHSDHQDSKARILNKYVNDNFELEEPTTFYDRRMRNEVKVQKKKTFESKLTSRFEKIVKTGDDYTVMIHGSEGFDDPKLFREKIIELMPKGTEEIINSVYYPADLLAANYALDNKMKNREFVPDELMHSDAMYKKIYEDMAQYADECILFIEALTPDLEYLITKFEEASKKITLIRSGSQTENLDEDWD